MLLAEKFVVPAPDLTSETTPPAPLSAMTELTMTLEKLALSVWFTPLVTAF